jgi:predicted metalloprotease with PDZ domain
LKTRVLTPSEFLDAMAKDLWRDFGSASEDAKIRNLVAGGSQESRKARPAKVRHNYFLLDLTLAFYGDSAGSLEEFLFSEFNELRKTPLSAVSFRRQLARERRVSQWLETLWSDADVRVPIGELLRPFGLLFNRRELPAFPFELTEAFQVMQDRNNSTVRTSSLQAGDRILAVNHHRLIMPDDLQKCRSQLGAENEVELSVERNGAFMRVQQRLGKEVLLRLEENKLADADKREKLERFLLRYSEGV